MHKILIIEDEKTLLETMQKVLSQEYQVYVASDGTDGLDVALKEKPDLILLDVMLPGLNGLELLEKLRQDTWGKNVPVIVLTNLSDLNTELKAKQLGVKDFLTKANISIKNLSNEVKKLLK